jgi:hypothetical protein
MPNVYIEVRPKGRPESGAIDDYVVENQAGIFPMSANILTIAALMAIALRLRKIN